MNYKKENDYFKDANLAIAGEDEIDLIRYPIENAKARDRINDACLSLKIDNDIIHRIIDVDATIPMGVITGVGVKTLVDVLTDFMNIAKNLPGDKVRYVTALKMHYGINEAKTDLVVFYQPLLLNLGVDDDDAPKMREYNTVEGQFYTFDSRFGFIPAPASYTDYKTRYLKRIKIKHRNLIAAYDHTIKDDSESSVFSFQEIFALVDDNPTDRLYIYNAMAPAENPLTDKRHGMVISTTHITEEEKFDGIFAGMSADLAHLCPPNCKVSFWLK